MPKRSGALSSHGARIEQVQSLKVDASRFIPGYHAADAKHGANGHEPTNHQRGVLQEPTASTKTKQPTLKRSKALSRPLADVTKMVNLASLKVNEESSEKSRQSKSITGVRGRHSSDEAFGHHGQAPIRKLEVYCDNVPAFQAAAPRLESKVTRAAASTAGDRNPQSAFDDSGITEYDAMGSGDEVGPRMPL